MGYFTKNIHGRLGESLTFGNVNSDRVDDDDDDDNYNDDDNNVYLYPLLPTTKKIYDQSPKNVLGKRSMTLSKSPVKLK